MPPEALYHVKLLAAIRSGDPALIHPFLAEIGKDRRSSNTLERDNNIDTGAAALHLAIRCASAQTVALLLSHRAISPNGVHPPGSGTTPLHIAASLGRADVVGLLLEQDGIDDTVRDAHGRTCKDVAKGKDVLKAINDSRSFLNASYRSLLRSYVLSSQPSPPQALLDLLSSPRAALIDLSYLDDSSGTSLLHEAAKRKDLRLIELAVRAGADVFVRNKKGKMPGEGGAAKDDEVRVFLRQVANHDRSLIQPPAPLTEPPMLKGYLNKYTNVAKGYNTRWFVLKHSILSYYRHQEDESIASRGSISMKSAIIKYSKDTRNRFEIHSTYSTGSGNNNNTGGGGSGTVQKWYIKANHPAEAARWVQALERSMEWCKRDAEKQHHGHVSNVSMGSMAAGMESLDLQRKKSRDSDQSLGISGNVKGVAHSIKSGILGRKKEKRMTTGMDGESVNVSLGDGGSRDGDVIDGIHRDEEVDEQDRDKDEDDSSTNESISKQPPHEVNFELHANATTAQLELTAQLLTSLASTSSSSSRSLSASSGSPTSKPISSSSPSSSLGSHPIPTSQIPQVQLPVSNQTDSGHLSVPTPASAISPSILSAIIESMTTLQSLFGEYTTMVHEREQWYARQLDSERKRQRIWEESLRTVVKEGAVLEEELRVRSRKRGSRVFGPSLAGSWIGGDTFGTTKGRGAGLPHVEAVLEEGAKKELVSTLSPVLEKENEKGEKERKDVTTSGVTESTSPTKAGFSPLHPRSPDLTLQSQLQEQVQTQVIVRSPDAVDDLDADGYTTDEEDEFFDAIESNTLPNLVVPPTLTSPTSTALLPSSFLVSLEQYLGYNNLRARLDVNDERPPTSLWSVLKHSIGKDLTKISFPVFFNEPTSMLQRMAEDMEFSECLDTASQQSDPLRRIAFVAAFAMSNYSSTIGRIAKPFNPMLSETFEYVRLDKKYRYVSEQVSHHPPISACWAESPLWHYYGEVDAQNKFMGKSFEIRPTGVAHTDLLIPEAWGPGYPKAPGVANRGKVVEHYTWKKVTTNVSGFILGSPTIDHYGDMVVTNHRTGDRCILTFKPRGWRGKDAFEISGHVMDAKGKPAYEIAGRWNSQLIARRVGAGHGVLHPDLSVSESSLSLSSLSRSRTLSHGNSTQEYILLWKNSQKPQGLPFNLTPFAITLNDCSRETLKPYLCPTDSRLRPDQRAFEIGKYELANDLKGKQEEKQRATRRAREAGQLESHRPRWFRAETDRDTGERVWEPIRVPVKVHDEHQDDSNTGIPGIVKEEKLEYWVERERVWKDGGRRKTQWRDVEEIFIEEPDIIRIV